MKCFDFNKKNKKICSIKNCRYWIKKSSSCNCCLIYANSSKSITLEEIGELFSVTRMRICQLEKKAIKKIKEKFKFN